MEEEMEFHEENYSTEEEIKEFQESYDKFREVYGKISKLTQSGVEKETKNPREVSKLTHEIMQSGQTSLIHDNHFRLWTIIKPP